MITDTLSFNRAFGFLFVISCLIRYSRIEFSKFSLIPVYLSCYVLLTSLWSVTGSFNDSISFVISMTMLIFMESFDDVNENEFFKLFNFAFILYGFSLAIQTFSKAGSLRVSQIVFDSAFNANTICSALSLSACIVFGCYSIGKGFNKYISYGFVGICIVAILLVGSRTSLIGLIGSIVITSLVANKYKGKSFSIKRIAAFLCVIGLLMAILYFIMHYNPEIYSRFTFSAEKRTDMLSVTRRTDVWDALLNYIIPQNLLFGVGFGLLNIKSAVAPYVLHAHHAHNMFLAIISETGVVGLSLFLMLYIVSFLRVYRSNSINKVFVISVLSFAFINGFGEEMLNQRWMWIFFGLIGVLLKDKKLVVKYDKNV